MSLMFYPAVIERAHAGFAVFFPGLACGGAGETVAAAVADAEQGLAAYLDVARDNGLAVPAPVEIDKIKVDPDIDEVARVLVRYEPPAHSVRLNITMDEALLKRVDAVAEREGFTRSGFLANAARRSLVEDAQGFRRDRVGKASMPPAKIGRDGVTGLFLPARAAKSGGTRVETVGRRAAKGSKARKKK